MRTVKLTVTTDAGGDGTATHGSVIYGRLVAVETDVDGLDAGADSTLTITGTASGSDVTLLTLTNVVTNAFYQMRALGSDAAAASTAEYIHPFVYGKPKVTVASGGNAKTARYFLYFE